MSGGRFLTLEGIEGVGKSTQIARLAAALAERGIDHVVTREPGGTPLAEKIRALVLNSRDESLPPAGELLLMFAARAVHLHNYIEPHLQSGRWVLCDRFTDASYAYQGGGRGMDLRAIAQLEQLVQGGRRPDLTLLLEAPVDQALARAQQRNSASVQDRFESERAEFFARVRATYLARAAAEPVAFRVDRCDAIRRYGCCTSLERVAGAGVDYLSANAMPWLAASQQKLRDSFAAGRMPHSLLLVSASGLGALPLAHWITAFALCDSAADRPCGLCASCQLLRADSHPDVHAVGLEEKAQQIKIEQVRELIESLALKSYRGGYKVGLIESAEALNTHSANAFLKTLEEPGAQTLLIMIAKPAHRLPATIASRCVRLTLRAPTPQAARTWLQANAPPQLSWDTALELAGGAPLLAMQLDAASLASLDAEMQASMSQLAAGSVDISLLAEHWLRSDPELRVHWLENWITRRVQAALAGPNSPQSAEPVRLPAALLKAKIRPLFELLDAARDYRRLAVTGLNQQLALEALLVGGRTALAK